MQNSTPNTNSFLKILAQIVSVVLHPIFIPLIASLIWYHYYPQDFTAINNQKKIDWLLTLFINTIFFPLLFVLLLKGLGFIKSILMKEPKERIIPLIGVMIFYFWVYFALSKDTALPIIAKSFLLGNYWSIIALFVITIFIKISMHTSGIGALLGMATLFIFTKTNNIDVNFIFVILCITALVFWARYKLKAHSNIELIIGLGLGILTQLGAYWYLK